MDQPCVDVLSHYNWLYFQVAISIATGFIFGLPEARLRHKVPTDRHVELYCDLPLYAFLAPLGYNLILILLCAIYGFLTRKLPDNFKESWYKSTD